MTTGFHNVIHEPILKRENINLPQLHIKLGLNEAGYKNITKNSYWKSIFLKISDAKKKEGIFVGPRQLREDTDFEVTMDENK